MRFIDKKEARKVNDDVLVRPNGVSDEQWNRALDLYEVARKKGDKFPELTVAQAALETGWFKHLSGNYNYFGQKAGKSQKGSAKVTNEYVDNTKITIVDRFRDYDSLDKAVDDRLKKWGSKYQNANNVKEAIGKIWSYDEKTGKGKGYATDINYDRKLTKILSMMGVDASANKKDFDVDTTEQRNIAITKKLQENTMKIDNTAVNQVDTRAVQKLLQPMVTNDVNEVTKGTDRVEEARDKIEIEENKLKFTKMLLSAVKVDAVDTSAENLQTNFQQGGKFDSDKNQKNFEEFYFPIYDKYVETTPTIEGEDKFPAVHPTVDNFVDNVMGATMSDLATGKRTVPPMDDDLKELQNLILEMPDEEMREIMSKDFGDINMFNFKKFLPEGVSTWQALKLLKKYKGYQKDGYTFQDGGKIMTDEELLLQEFDKIEEQKEQDELARLYRRKGSRVKNALNFSRVAGKRVRKTKLA